MGAVSGADADAAAAALAAFFAMAILFFLLGFFLTAGVGVGSSPASVMITSVGVGCVRSMGSLWGGLVGLLRTSEPSPGYGTILALLERSETEVSLGSL